MQLKMSNYAFFMAKQIKLGVRTVEIFFFLRNKNETDIKVKESILHSD